MEKYDVISVVGEGSYGLVMRCRHRESGQYVAIKKFLETEDDPTVRKMALREIRMLKKLRHENLVNMLEVFRRKKRFFLVFEYLEHTVLEQLEARVGGLGYATARKYCFQVLRALDFIHSHDVIHRDIKPENVLVSRLGIIKLCDFGFARPYAENETFTDYVATRWYRSPELLVGDPRYGKEVDIWAVGCLFAEMMTGEPLFPGESDIDQLFQIIRVCGKLNARHQLLVARNAMFKGMKQEQNTSLHQMYPDWSRDALDFLQQTLRMDGHQQRPDSERLLDHELFTADRFNETFLVEMRSKLAQEMQGTPLLKRMPSYGSGRKSLVGAAAAANAQNNAKRSGGGSNKTTSDDRFAPSSTKANPTQIGLSLFSEPSAPPPPPVQQQRRFSTSTGDEIVGLNLSTLRQYLHNAQHTRPVLNINTLLFNEAPQQQQPGLPSTVASRSGSRSRIASAKPKATGGDAAKDISPVHYQSMQPESLGIADGHPTGQSKRLSPAANAAALLAAAPPYFSQRRSSNIIGLQQVVAAQQLHKAKPAPLLLAANKKRDRLLDVALMPLSIGDGGANSKEHSPRALPNAPAWMSTGNLKITAQAEGKSAVHQLGRRGMTDWKSTAAAGGSKVTGGGPTTTTTTPPAGDSATAAPSFGDLLLPTCPGATGISTYKPSGSRHLNANKLKLSPIVTTTTNGAGLFDTFDDLSDFRKS